MDIIIKLGALEVMASPALESSPPEGTGTFARALPASSLYRPADLSGQKFATTTELVPAERFVGQRRALDAIALGTQMKARGFNLFVTGPAGAGMREAVRSALTEAARAKAPPPDWVYVYNFADPHKPIAIDLPPGRAPQFRDAMRDLIADLKIALPAAFEREDYQTRRGAIDEAVRKSQHEAFSALCEKAEAKNVAIVRTPLGFALAPARNGQVVPPDEFNTWPDEQRRLAQEAIHELEGDLEQVLRQLPRWEKERRDQLRQLNRDTAKLAVGQSIEEVEAVFTDLAKVREHLARAREDLIENAGMFMMRGEGDGTDPEERGVGGLFDRYEVNVLVTRSDEPGCPVMEEMHPTLVNLICRVEYAARQGVLFTNFRLIKAGALHRANGGYLVIDVRAILSEPFSWAALKRALRQHEITIEDVSHFMGLAGTVSLEPDPIPLDIKIVLVGDRLLYYLLADFDP